jgi:RNA polymerase sigma-70 factor (ECF subfamily)
MSRASRSRIPARGIAGNAAEPWASADASNIERALARLPALTRSVLWLFHVEEYTHQEIAELTGKSISFSKTQVMRGNQRLRHLLEAETSRNHEEITPWLSPATAV